MGITGWCFGTWPPHIHYECCWDVSAALPSEPPRGEVTVLWKYLIHSPESPTISTPPSPTAWGIPSASASHVAAIPEWVLNSVVALVTADWLAAIIIWHLIRRTCSWSHPAALWGSHTVDIQTQQHIPYTHMHIRCMYCAWIILTIHNVW